MKQIMMLLACVVLVAGCAANSRLLICPCEPAGGWTVIAIQACDSAALEYGRLNRDVALGMVARQRLERIEKPYCPQGMTPAGYQLWRAGRRSLMLMASDEYRSFSYATLDSILDDAVARTEYRFRLRHRTREEGW